MNFLENIIPNNLIESFGWMIVHSLWQGALVAALLSVALLMLNKKSARVRYLVSVGALLFFAAMSIRTFIDHYSITKDQSSVNQVTEISKTTDTEIIPENFAEVNESNLFETISAEFSGYFYNHFSLIVTFYLMGVLLLTLKLSGGYIYSQRIKHYKTYPADKNIIRLSGELAEKLFIKQTVKVFESALIKAPVTLGYLKPVILFPLGTLTGMSYAQIEAILAHELAHIKRADYLINLFQSLLEVIFFYHPAVWWISSLVREERENICDDLALSISNRPTDLATALVLVSEYSTGEYSLAMSAIGNKNKLLRRVKRMMGENNKSKKSKVYAASLVLLMAITFGAAACSTANGQSYHSEKDNLVYVEDRDGDANYINTDYKENDERTYVFYKRFKGDKSKWEATVDGKKIVALYRDGNAIPQNDFYKYEDMILDEVEEIDWRLQDLREELADLQDNLRDLKINLDDDFAEEMSSLARELKSEFNSQEFKNEMKELKRELESINKHNFNIQFDSEELAEVMRDMKEELSNMDFNIEIDWDSDDFKKEMKQLSKELADIKVNIDMSDLHESMQDLKEEMKNLDIDMSDLKKEMEILGDYLDELTDEMIDDGLIDDKDDLRRVEFEDDAMYVNNKKVPEELYKKYREIHKKYYNEYPHDNSFRFNDDDRW